MITILFCIISSIMIVIQTKREGNFINLASLLMAPYIAFVFINNFFFYKRGFYKISDAVLLMILSAFVCFFISGLMIFPGEFPKIYEEDNELIRNDVIAGVSNQILSKNGSYLGLIGLQLLNNDMKILERQVN